MRENAVTYVEFCVHYCEAEGRGPIGGAVVVLRLTPAVCPTGVLSRSIRPWYAAESQVLLFTST